MCLTDLPSQGHPYSVWKHLELCHCPWFQWISLVWMYVTILAAAPCRGCCRERKLTVPTYETHVNLKEMGTGSLACLSDHWHKQVFLGVTGNTAACYTTFTRLWFAQNSTTTVLQRHLVTHMDASNALSSCFCLISLHWTEQPMVLQRKERFTFNSSDN